METEIANALAEHTDDTWHYTEAANLKEIFDDYDRSCSINLTVIFSPETHCSIDTKTSLP